VKPTVDKEGEYMKCPNLKCDGDMTLEGMECELYDTNDNIIKAERWYCGQCFTEVTVPTVDEEG